MYRMDYCFRMAVYGHLKSIFDCNRDTRTRDLKLPRLCPRTMAFDTYDVGSHRHPSCRQYPREKILGPRRNYRQYMPYIILPDCDGYFDLFGTTYRCKLCFHRVHQ